MTHEHEHEARNGSFTASQVADSSNTPSPSTQQASARAEKLAAVISELDALVQAETRTLAAMARTSGRAALAAVPASTAAGGRMLLDLAAVFAAIGANSQMMSDAVNATAEDVGCNFDGVQL
jgi:hypothetical protein